MIRVREAGLEVVPHVGRYLSMRHIRKGSTKEMIMNVQSVVSREVQRVYE